MIEDIFLEYVRISITLTLIILIMLPFFYYMEKKYKSKYRYFLWIAICVRLIIPINITISTMPQNIKVPSFLYNYSTVVTYINNPIDEISITKIIAAIWGIGVITFIAFKIISYFYNFSDIKRWSKPCNDIELLNILDSTKAELKITKGIDIWICMNAVSPFIIGVLHPKIILPNTIVSLNSTELSVILRHELIHCIHHDIIYKFIILTAQTLHWFNPILCYFINKGTLSIEEYCDDTAIEGKGIEYATTTYSNAILTLMKAPQKEYKGIISNHFSGGMNFMKKRIRNICNSNKKKNGRFFASAILIMLISINVLTSCSTKNNNAIDVVRSNLSAQSEDDIEKWKSTLSSPDDWNIDTFGITSIKIDSIEDSNDQRYIDDILKSEFAKNNNWTEDNIAVVIANYNVTYDHTKVAKSDGLKNEVFILIRLDQKSPWLIADWGSVRY